jgi:2,3-diketo-5-methylthio-1-phosphopentane phosphatase
MSMSSSSSSSKSTTASTSTSVQASAASKSSSSSSAASTSTYALGALAVAATCIGGYFLYGKYKQYKQTATDNSDSTADWSNHTLAGNATQSFSSGSSLSSMLSSLPPLTPDPNAEAKDQPVDLQSMGVKYVLLDIEGTVMPIAYVHNIMFPYAKAKCGDHLKATWDTETTRADVQKLLELSEQDAKDGVPGVIVIPRLSSTVSDEQQREFVIKNVTWQMSVDRKSTALKQLQGHIWSTAFKNQELKAAFFEDVEVAIKQLTSSGVKVGIYSSGSVEAQKQVFGNPLSGTNMNLLISDYFDTNVGGKKEQSSYVKIANALGLKPEQILFLTDILEEGDAAEAAGMHVIFTERPGNQPLPAKACATKRRSSLISIVPKK